MEAATAAVPTTPTRRLSDPAIVVGALALLSFALIPFEIHRAFGLPAHPLLIHAPVIFIPVLCLALLAVAAKPVWFDRFGVPMGFLAVISLGSTFLAVAAGEAFRDDRGQRSGAELQRLNEHADSGETLRLIMIGVTFFVVVALALSRSRRGFTLPFLSGIARAGWVPPAMRGLFAIGAVAAMFFVIRTGHLGAQVTWSQRGGDGGPAAGGVLPGQPPAGARPGGDGD